VAAAAEVAGDAEVDGDRLDVADVQVAVRLGREARDDGLVFAVPEIGGHDLTDENRLVPARLPRAGLMSRWSRRVGSRLAASGAASLMGLDTDCTRFRDGRRVDAVSVTRE